MSLSDETILAIQGLDSDLYRELQQQLSLPPVVGEFSEIHKEASDLELQNLRERLKELETDWNKWLLFEQRWRSAIQSSVTTELALLTQDLRDAVGADPEIRLIKHRTLALLSIYPATNDELLGTLETWSSDVEAARNS